MESKEPTIDERPGASRWVPSTDDLATLRHAASACRGCELWEPASQVVFSAGSATASLFVVGEQPGDVEDREGTPFVGPAGRLLDEILDEAGIDRSDVYLTNAVKHFRFSIRGKRRIHETPDLAHLTACRPWLDSELRIVAPRLVVVLGAVAARSLLGSSVRVTKQRGTIIERGRYSFMPTVHPASVLRAPDDERPAARKALVEDMRTARRVVARVVTQEV